MNVAHLQETTVCPRLAFVSGLGFGGSTTFLCHLTTELVRRGVPVLVVSPECNNAFASDFQAGGVPVVVQGARMIFEDRLRAVLKTLAEFQPTTVVGCVGADSYEVLRYMPKAVHRLALIQTDSPMHYDTAIFYGGCMDGIVGISTQITNRLSGLPAFNLVNKLCLLHGVPIPRLVGPREGHDRPLRILYLGRIVNGQKRVLLFPEILKVLQNSGIPFQWNLVGEGEQRAELERLLVSADPRQSVRFLGPVNNAQVPAILEQHDIFLLASDAEGLPISLLEAMAHGLVAVVTDLASGIRDVVDDGNGMLVPVDDVAGYARAIIHLHHHREELAAKSAAAHARVAKDFSVAAMTDRWLAALPASPAEIKSWPNSWRIQAPLAARNKFKFFPPLRFIRRAVLRFQSFWR